MGDPLNQDEDELDMPDADELELIEEQDPFIAESIGYYCKFCKVCRTCKCIGRCRHGSMKRACKHCKYCKPKAYWDMIRRIRIRIRVRRVRVRRVRVRRFRVRRARVRRMRVRRWGKK